MAKFLDANGVKRFKEHIEALIHQGDTISHDFSVELGNDGALGKYKTDDVISSNTPIETIIKNLLQKQIAPTYSTPQITIHSNGGTEPKSYEYGTVIKPNITAFFMQNDAGSLKTLSLVQDGVEKINSSQPSLNYEGDEFTLTQNTKFKAIAEYEEGSIKDDNLGDPFEDGHILEGSIVSNELAYKVYRQGYFVGILDSSSDVEITSDVIRDGIMKNGKYEPCNIGTADSPIIKASDVSDRKRIFVACPSTEKGLVKVIMPSAMGFDCTPEFVKQEEAVVVKGANDTDGIEYNVWVYEPALITDDQTFVITLG